LIENRLNNQLNSFMVYRELFVIIIFD